MKPSYSKTALSCLEQLALLKQRGLMIADEASALRHLSHIGYYRLSGYWLPFKQGNDSLLGSFDEAVILYEFDRALRLLIMDAIERFEVHIRTNLALTIGTAHGAFGHENEQNFRQNFGDGRGRSSHGEWLDRVREETQRSHEVFIKAYQDKYRDYPKLPVWMATEVMSFGTLSRLYGALLPDQQRVIAQPFGLHISVLHNWLHVLSTARNIAAHHGRLWNRDLSIQPKLPHRDPVFAEAMIPNKRRSYVLVLMLRQLTAQHHQANTWIRAVIELMHRWDAHPLWQQAMGLPANWCDLPAWRVPS